MAIPSAAGFIPSQSMVGDILRLVEMFGSEGKERRKLENERLGAETQNIRDMSARNWAELDQREKARLAQEEQFWNGLLPVQKEQNAINSRQVATGERKQKMDEDTYSDRAAQIWSQIQGHNRLNDAQAKVFESRTDPKTKASDDLMQLLSNPIFSMSVPQNTRQALSMGMLSNLAGMSENPAGNELFEQMKRAAAERARLSADMASGTNAPPTAGNIIGTSLVSPLLGLYQGLKALTSGPQGSNPPTQQGQPSGQQAPPQQSAPSAGSPAARPGQSRIPSTMRLPVPAQPPDSGPIEGPLPTKEPGQTNVLDPVWEMISPSRLQGGAQPVQGQAQAPYDFTTPYGFPSWIINLLNEQMIGAQ